MSYRGNRGKDKTARISSDFISRVMQAMVSPNPGEMVDLLAEGDFKRFQRLKFLHGLNLQHGVELSDKEKYRMYHRETGCFERTFWSDMRECRAIFGPTIMPDLEYLRGVELQIAIRDRSLARAAGDFKAVVSFSKQIMELFGLNRIQIAEGDTGAPQQIITNIQINYADGSQQELKLDFDALEKLKPQELEQLATILDAPAIGVAQMEKMLHINEPTDPGQV